MVLLYDVAKGKLTAARSQLHRSSIYGESLKVRVSDGTVTVGGARVITADIGASNGVIDVIKQGADPR